MSSHVVANSRVFEMVLGACRGFNTSSKSFASLSNVEIWQLDE